MAERNWREDWELTKRATPGPWEYFQGDLIGANGKGLQYFTKIFPREWGPFWCNQNDPVFIAQAREALPYWLQRVRELEKTCLELQKQITSLGNKVATLKAENERLQIQCASLDHKATTLEAENERITEANRKYHKMQWGNPK